MTLCCESFFLSAGKKTFCPLCGSTRNMSESCYEFPLVLLTLFVAVVVDCIFHFVERMWHVVGRQLEKHTQGPLTLHYFTLPELWALCQQDFDIQWTLVTKSCLGKGVFPPHAELARNSRVGFFFFASLFLEAVHSLQEDSSHQKPQMKCRKQRYHFAFIAHGPNNARSVWICNLVFNFWFN